MLHGNKFILHPGGFISGRTKGLIQISGNIDFAFLAGKTADLGQFLQQIFRIALQRLHIHIHLGQQLRNQSLGLGKQGREQMDLLQLLMPVLGGDALGALNGLHGFLRVLILAHLPFLISNKIMERSMIID